MGSVWIFPQVIVFPRDNDALRYSPAVRIAPDHLQVRLGGPHSLTLARFGNCAITRADPPPNLVGEATET